MCSLLIQESSDIPLKNWSWHPSIAPLYLLGDPGYQLAENDRELQHGEDWELDLQ
jgi:hypothetical protein